VKSPIKSGGTIRPIGDVVELEEKVAAPLLAAKNVELHDPKAAFQAAMSEAESAAQALEAAGGDPGEVASELRRRQAAEQRAVDEAIDVSAVLVASGAMSADDAATQICAQVPSAKPAEVLIVLQQKAAQLKEQEEAAARDRSTASRVASDKAPEAKPEKKKK
jgi:hypothetical protein